MDGIDAGKKHPYLTLSSLLLSPQNDFSFLSLFIFFLFGLSAVWVFGQRESIRSASLLMTEPSK